MKSNEFGWAVLVLAMLACGCKKTPANDLSAMTPTEAAAQLCKTARAGNIEEIQSLLAAGTSVNAKDYSGRIPLHYAAWAGHVDAVKLLLAKGANINATCSTGTPLHMAAKQGHDQVIKLLLEKGAFVGARDREGNTPLHSAMERARKAVATVLLDHDADVDARNDNGSSPLHMAVDTLEEDSVLDLVKLLVARGADINIKDDFEYRPLHDAISMAPREVAEFLIAKGADVNVKSADQGQMPLHRAAIKGDKKIVRLLIGKGADLTARDHQGRTASDWARALGHASLVTLLMQSSPEHDPGDNHDDGPLSFVTAGEEEGIAKLLNRLHPLVLGNSAFAFDLYQQQCSSEGNLFFSPHSISSALAMVYGGVRANTEKQMAEVLHFTRGQTDVHSGVASLESALAEIQQGNGVELRTANSLWAQHSESFLSKYLSLIDQCYDASITQVDFTGDLEATRQSINKWVDGKTEGKIRDLIQPGTLDTLTRFVLVNAIYFKGTWAHPFHPRNTKNAPFYLSAEKYVTTPTMRQTLSTQYAEFGSAQVLELPYVDNKLSMLILLPRKIDGLGALEQSLSMENLTAWRQGLRQRKVRIWLPTFQVALQWRLDKTLQALGMTDAFSGTRADFSGMTDKPGLFISAVVHQAYVNVNEKGTEAAAATGAVGGRGRTVEPPTFRADHPFLFLIQDNRNGNILFMGRVSDPSEAG